MVRRCAEENVQHIDEVKKFTVNGYSFSGELSCANEFVFLKIKIFNLPAANAAGFFIICISG